MLKMVYFVLRWPVFKEIKNHIKSLLLQQKRKKDLKVMGFKGFEFALYSCLNVKELLARNRPDT